MRCLVLFIGLLISLPALAQGFGGAWTATLCADGASRRAGECSTFVLELMEKDGQLCGAHLYATPGAQQIDEGAAPSLTGDIAERTASATAISQTGGARVSMPVELQLDGARLRWRRLEKPAGPSLLPEKATLSRSAKRTLFAPLFEQELRAACTYIFNLEAMRRAPAVPGSQGGAAPVPAR